MTTLALAASSGGVTLTLAAVFYLVALILFVICAFFLPLFHPRLSYTAFACVAAGLLCQSIGLGQ